MVDSSGWQRAMTSGKATSKTNEDDMALVQGLCAAEEVQSTHAQWQQASR